MPQNNTEKKTERCHHVGLGSARILTDYALRKHWTRVTAHLMSYDYNEMSTYCLLIYLVVLAQTCMSPTYPSVNMLGKEKPSNH